MCQPGDYTVTPVPNGYMIGRLIDRPAVPGSSWEYVRAEADLQTALTLARTLAERAGVRAWIYEHPQAFVEITDRPHRDPAP